jgi:NAD(P)-dependent dehydrogenase (short-subunit alcohol dehydrogenase family)
VCRCQDLGPEGFSINAAVSAEHAVRFDGQAVLVTGAGRGLGRAYALLLAERGASVLVHDAGVAADGSGFDPTVADAVVAEIRAARGVAEPAYDNLETREGCEGAVAAALENFGRLDALIHNAGVSLHRTLEETDEEMWSRLLRVNAESAFRLARAAFPAMRAQRYGRIVLTLSGHALYSDASSAELAAYATTKAAQFGLMNALAAAGEPHGICVNAISPVAATRMFTREVAAGELRPEQVAPGAVFLASRQCSVSAVVLRAANGRFSLGGYAVTQGLDLGLQPSTPEIVAARWDEIAAGFGWP